MITLQFFHTAVTWMLAKMFCILSMYHTVYSQVSQENSSKLGRLKNLTKLQRMLKLLFNTSQTQILELTADYIQFGLFHCGSLLFLW